ncbi:MAG: hypothetical protein E7523_04715 [Ruminococcaceae bacterium]|nr:hypothetical protein [Oscillospiraceae bacterium]
MTIRQAIARFDTLYPNEIPYEQKLAWLSELDGIVYEEILSFYKEAPPTAFTGYILATPGDSQLLVPFPYDKIYIEYLSSKTELVRGNAERYNNAATLYANTFDAFAADYNRTHTPLQNVQVHF